MRNRLALIVAFCLITAACGVSRDEPIALDGDSATSDDDEATTTDEEPADDEVADGLVDVPFEPVDATVDAPDADVAAAITLPSGATAEITFGELNEIVSATTENEQSVNLLFNGVVPPDFAAVALNLAVFDAVVEAEVGTSGGEITEAEVTAADQLLVPQIAAAFPTATDPAADAQQALAEMPYLGLLRDFRAGQIALANTLAATAEPGPDVPCVRHILFSVEVAPDADDETVAQIEAEAEAQANDALAELAAGADFATLAQERSTGPSGPNGGDLGCSDTSAWVPPFAEAVDAATVGEPVGPVQTDFGFHVILVEGFEPAPPPNGDALAEQQVREALATADIVVDPRVGSWDPINGTILPG
ncbi:MAG: peptidylprolyl isomerase [Actinomycetota bacterium]